MKPAHRSLLVFSALLLLTADFDLYSQPAEQKIARGVVFHDVNQNGIFDRGDTILRNVKVSNGKDIVQTDSRGRYELPIDDDTIIFVIKPRGWRTPLNENFLPQFYYIHKPNGSPRLKYPGVEPTGDLPESVDFALSPQREPDAFRALLFGDPQPRDQKELDYIAHDVIEELIGTDASFGVTLGDILFDDLSLFESSSRTIGLLGIPWYNVIGNHDINFDAQHDRYSDETFERAFGPSYYSFDYGQVHFLVLDDVEWIYSEENKKGRYRGGLGDRQMQFIKNDLARIPENQMVVLMMHIPLINVADRQQLYRLIEQRPFCLSISGHTHHHEHRFITKEDGWQGPEPHHHIINVTVSGSWWGGAPDERGIPQTMMADGAPNGYSILSFDGKEYKLDFKAASRPADYQMKIMVPEEIAAAESEQTDLFVNVFNGSSKSKVEFRIGKGAWQTMKLKPEHDPEFVATAERENNVKDKTWRNLPKPKICPHLWHSKLSQDELEPGTQKIEVRTTDMFGRTYNAHRVIRIK